MTEQLMHPLPLWLEVGITMVIVAGNLYYENHGVAMALAFMMCVYLLVQLFP